MICGNNLKQLGWGLHNYHAAVQQLPMHGPANDENESVKTAAAERNDGQRIPRVWSFLIFVGLLDRFLTTIVVEQVQQPRCSERATATVHEPAFGDPRPIRRSLPPWLTGEISTLRLSERNPGVRFWPALGRNTN